MQADLTDPTSLPATMVGVHTVIDCATARPEESTSSVDWEGKKALIQCAQAMGVQKYVFCSILDCDQHQEVPLMQIKACTEEFLKASDLDFTILRLCGFHQAIIGNYAVPILEEKPVWGTTEETRTAYLDSVDLARMLMASLRAPKASRSVLTLAGPKAWSTSEVRMCPLSHVCCTHTCVVIHASVLVHPPMCCRRRTLEACGAWVPCCPYLTRRDSTDCPRKSGLQVNDCVCTLQVIELCEKLAECDAKVNNVPGVVLKLARNVLKGFQWARDAADRLAFAEVLSSHENLPSEMKETYEVLNIDPASITSLDTYLEEYYSRILKKLKEVGASSKQTDFYV